MCEASLNRGLILDESTLSKLRRNSPAGGWFPALRDLRWTIVECNLPYADLFFSANLRTVVISTSLKVGAGVHRDILLAIASAFSALPTLTLQYLDVDFYHRDIPWAPFEDLLSSIVLRCGPPLTKFSSPPLLDAATNHLIHLPHLRSWVVKVPPPNYSTSSLPLTFPPLTEFTVGEDAAYEWLSLFKRLEAPISTTRAVTPLSRVKESLESLHIQRHPGAIFDDSFTSQIQIFHNLTYLNVGVRCHGNNNDRQCAFKLNNDNVTELAIALPRLKSLLLGPPCFKNVCATTVACLLPISVYCLKLNRLEIHFNTANIIEDFKGISEDPQFQELQVLPRSRLHVLDVWEMPLTLDKPGIEAVANGMANIFPSLDFCSGTLDFFPRTRGRNTWSRISRRIGELTGNAVGECRLTVPFRLIHSCTEAHE